MKSLLIIFLVTLNFSIYANDIYYGLMINTKGVEYGHGSSSDPYQFILHFDGYGSCEINNYGTEHGYYTTLIRSPECSDLLKEHYQSLSSIEFIGSDDGVYLGDIELWTSTSKSTRYLGEFKYIKSFHHNRWVDNKRDNEKLDRVIYTDAVKYNIEIVTGDKRFAGTDSYIKLDIISDVESKSIYDYQPDNKNNNFEKGASDFFELYQRDFNNIKKICVSSNGQGDNSFWYADKIVITNVGKNKRYIFDINSWFFSDKKCFLPRK